MVASVAGDASGFATDNLAQRGGRCTGSDKDSKSLFSDPTGLSETAVCQTSRS